MGDQESAFQLYWGVRDGVAKNPKHRFNNAEIMRPKLQPPNFVKCLSRWQAGEGLDRRMEHSGTGEGG